MISNHHRKTCKTGKCEIPVMLPLLFFLLFLLFPFWASADFRKHPEKIPVAAARAIAKAQTLAKAGKTDAALKLLERFKAKGDCGDAAGASGVYCHFQVDFNMGNLHMVKGLHKSAADCYRIAVDRNPIFFPAWINLASACNELGRFKEASTAFVRAYETSETPKATHLYYGAVCSIQAKDRSGALKIFERLLGEHGDSFRVEWREALVSVLLDMKHEKRALPHMERLARETKGKRKIRWQEMLLYQYMALGLDKKAYKYVSFLTATYPLESKWWKGLAHFHLGKSRYRQALVALTVYGELSPLTEKEQKLVADLNFTLGIPVEGVRHYLRLIEGGTLSVERAKRVCMGYRSLHLKETALEWAERGLALGDDPDLLMIKANLVYELERFEEASRLFRGIAIEGKKGAPGAWMMAGYAALNAGNITGARNAFNKAAGFKEKKKEAHRILAQLIHY